MTDSDKVEKELPSEAAGGELSGEPAGGEPSGEPAGGEPAGGEPSGELSGEPAGGKPAGGEPSGEPAGNKPDGEDQDEKKAWYIVHTQSNFEQRVCDTIKERMVPQGLAEYFDEMLVPVEEVLEMRRGQNKEVKRKLFPGYLLLKMEMNGETQHFIRNLPRVTGFLGDADSPQPLSQGEVDRILGQMRQGVDRPRPSVIFSIGEQVRVSDGPFASFNGVVEDVDVERSRLKVSVSIFGRSTPVELGYNQVEKG